MQFQPLIPELSVSDIHRTRVFYLDILGFRLCYERPEDRFLFVEKDGSQLMLEQNNGNWNTGEMVYPYGRGINFEMTVRDVDALYDSVLRHGIEPFRPMETVTYRCGGTDVVQKQFLVQDPDGYLLRFVD